MKQSMPNPVAQRLASVFGELSAITAYWPRMFRLLWQASPPLLLAWSALLVIQGLTPLPLVYLSKALVDRMLVAVAANGAWEQVWPVVEVVGMMLGITVLASISQGAMDLVRAAHSALIRDHISALIHQQSVAVDLAFYESAEFYDRLDRARSEAPNRSLALLESFGGLAQNAITLLAMSVLLIGYGIWLPILLLISTLPALFVVVRSNRRNHRWWERTTSTRRWAQYYDSMLTQGSSAAEVRLFSLGSHFQSTFQALRKELRTAYLKLARSEGMARLAAGATAAVCGGAALVWMGWRAIQGQVTLGDLALFYQAFSQGQNLLRGLLSSAGQIYGNSLFLRELFTFLDLSPEVVDPLLPSRAPATLQRGVRFEGITFRYPGSERTALQNFSLDLQAGRVTAIVGANGAGKSTLIKLLCRFYDPQQGRISLDGIDMREFAVADVRRMISVLFQQPVAYHATAEQNIALSDLAAAPDREAIESAARSAGAHELISRLPRGYETRLGKWFADGADLSGGEWQRIALARAFLRQAPIVILDEPTSAMDSWAEAEWLERFRELVAGRTALIITHRFTTAMRADVIHVMDGGQVIESGSHEELLQLGGRYADSWRAQMQAGEPAHELVEGYL